MVSGATNREEDELSFTVSPFSGSVRPSLAPGDEGGPEADPQLTALLQRVAWLEEQLAGAQREDREAAGWCTKLSKQFEQLAQAFEEERCQHRGSNLPTWSNLPTLEGELQLRVPAEMESNKASTGALEAASAARLAEAQLQRATAEAQRVESAVRAEISNTIGQARSFLDQEWIKHCTAPDGDTKVLMTRGQQTRSTECLGLRIDALELHINGRLEALEEVIANGSEKPFHDNQQMKKWAFSVIQEAFHDSDKLEKWAGGVLQEVESRIHVHVNAEREAREAMITSSLNAERGAREEMISSLDIWRRNTDAMISTRLDAERVAADSMISNRLDAWRIANDSMISGMISGRLDIERAERVKCFEEERSRTMEAVGEHQQALAKALGEELETSIVSQAVAEVRAAACQAAREEACGEIAELRQKVSELVDRLEASKRFSTGMSRHESTATLPPGAAASPAPSEAEHSFSDSASGAKALHQFGESVIQLEGNIKSLLQSSVEARSEQKREHTALRGEMEKLQTQVQQVISRDLPQVWELLEATQRTGAETTTLCSPGRQKIQQDRCAAQPSGTYTPAAPNWRLAMLPSPSRSPARGPKALSPGPSRHSGSHSYSCSAQPPNRQHCSRQASPQMGPGRRTASPGSSASVAPCSSPSAERREVSPPNSKTQSAPKLAPYAMSSSGSPPSLRRF